MRNLHQGVHHHLKLEHHKHTGRVLRHKHTSYRGLGAIFILAGLVIVATALVQRAAADSLFSVSAVVPVPVPYASAVISTPADDSSVQSSDVLVAGNCPIVSPAVTVVVIMDGTVAGSALCSSSNNFALPLHLALGNHTLATQTYTVTGGQGPESPAVTVTYQPNTISAETHRNETTKSASATTTKNTAPALIPTDPFNLVGADNTADWNGRINGGTAPYRITVDWGDGNRNTYTTTDAQLHYIHQYHTSESHNITLAVADGSNQFAQMHYAAVNYFAVMNTPAALLSTTAASGNPNARILAGLYGLYITALAGSAIIWIEAKHAARHEAAAETSQA
jgi:hypothetical protein